MTVAIVYSDEFLHYPMCPNHPESPLRIASCLKALKNVSCSWIEPSTLDDEILQLCHTKKYLQIVQRDVLELQKSENDFIFLSTGDVVISKNSYDVAKKAVGAACRAVDAVCRGDFRHALSLARPPGHHAGSDFGMGFCIFNNVAVAARYAQKNYNAKKICIVDWDVHHGNGTEAIFHDDPSILYFSTHELGNFPGTGLQSTKNMLNCPIVGGVGSREKIFEAIETVLLPAIKTFSPDLCIVSAGFDAHKSDPLANCLLETEDYYTLTKKILSVYSGGIVSCLEGGYNTEVLGPSLLAHINALV